jgi:hypothetical protein
VTETPCCGRCTAYRPLPAAGPGKGICYLLPPVPICAGMIQPTAGLAGIRATGPQPLMLNARPQVADTEWCAQFHPVEVPEVEVKPNTWYETGFVPGEGLVTREVPAAEIAPSEPWSGAREAVEPPKEWDH